MGTLPYGDNLDILRRYLAASVAMIYLDPPFAPRKPTTPPFQEKDGTAAVQVNSGLR